MKSMLMSHPDCMNHRMGRHPERPERLQAVMDLMEQSGIAKEMRNIQASEVTNSDLALVHPMTHISFIEGSEQKDNIVLIDPDTFMSEGSTRAAKLAVGAVVETTREVLENNIKRGFCAIRPPGHHAELAAAMGFCLFNNVAVAARVALDHPDINRIAICDFDVHHCNGTVDIFKEDERVLVCSSFQDNFYPNRYLDFSNEHIIITPLAAGTSGSDFRRAIEQQWLSEIQSHDPDLIFISAGFDAHRDDPLGGLNLIDEDYRWITRMIVELANSHAAGRIVSTLEGGYDLDALAQSSLAHVEELIL